MPGLTGFKEKKCEESEREKKAAAVSISLIRDFTPAAKTRGELNQENGAAAA